MIKTLLLLPLMILDNNAANKDKPERQKYMTIATVATRKHKKKGYDKKINDNNKRYTKTQ